jgi:glycogen synthase
MHSAVASLLPLPSAPLGVRPGRILMTADTVGGVWTYALELCRGLTDKGVEVVLATMGAPLSADQRAEAKVVGGLIIEESSYRLEWMDEAAEDVQAAGEWLQRLVQQHQPDLVHFNGYAHAGLEWDRPVLVVAHSCVHTWWRSVHGGGEPPSCFDHYTSELRRGVGQVDLLVAPTAAFLRDFRAAHGDVAPSEVVPNGRDPAAFRVATAKEPVFLSVGRLWDEAKNARLLAELAPDLSWPVRLLGDATSPDGRQLELINVELPGRCPPAEVAEHLARAAVYVSPARYEPFGLSVLEAALSGCALALSDIPTLRELWHDAAVFVAPGDADGWRRSLRWLAEDSEQRAELAFRAQERAATFTAEAMTRRYLAIYQNLLASAAGPQSSRASASA